MPSKLYAYTIHVVMPDEDSDPTNILTYSPSITLQPLKGPKSICGLDLGKVPEDDIHPDKNLLTVQGATPGSIHACLTVSEPNEYGYRSLCIPSDDAEVDEDQALIYLDAKDPCTELRFVQANILQRDGLLMEGRLYDTKPGSHFYSCPALLVAQRNEDYMFSFFSKKTYSSYIVSFHWDFDIIVTDVQQRSVRRKVSTISDNDRPQRRSMTNNNWSGNLFDLAEDTYTSMRRTKHDRKQQRKRRDMEYMEKFFKKY